MKVMRLESALRSLQTAQFGPPARTAVSPAQVEGVGKVVVKVSGRNLDFVFSKYISVFLKLSIGFSLKL